MKIINSEKYKVSYDPHHNEKWHKGMIAALSTHSPRLGQWVDNIIQDILQSPDSGQQFTTLDRLDQFLNIYFSDLVEWFNTKLPDDIENWSFNRVQQNVKRWKEKQKT